MFYAATIPLSINCANACVPARANPTNTFKLLRVLLSTVYNLKGREIGKNLKAQDYLTDQLRIVNSRLGRLSGT